MSAKPHLNLVVIGHIDHGKSTLVGHILYLTGFVGQKRVPRDRRRGQKKRTRR